MRSTLRARLAVGAALLLGACASNTQVVNSWKDPNVPPRHFKKVLAVFISPDAALRRSAEDELARKLEGAVPAYTVLPDSIMRDREKAEAWVKREGYDGAVIMRPVGLDQETTYVPGQAYVVPAGYASMWRYWGSGWAYAYDPGYVRKDQVVSVESNVYSVADEKLVWASRTKTYNPESVRELVDEIVDQTVAVMKREKAFAAAGSSVPPQAT
jgi:hypothetical protein